MKPNWKHLLVVGLVAGLFQAAAGIAMYLAGVYFTPWSMLVTLVVLLLCIVLGTRWYAQQLKRELTYGHALIAGVVISVSTGVIYAIYNIISISYFYPNFLSEYARISAGIAATNATASPPAEDIASTREMATANAIAIGNLIRLSVGGTLLSLLASLIFKEKRKS